MLIERYAYKVKFRVCGKKYLEKYGEGWKEEIWSKNTLCRRLKDDNFIIDEAKEGVFKTEEIIFK